MQEGVQGHWDHVKISLLNMNEQPPKLLPVERTRLLRIGERLQADVDLPLWMAEVIDRLGKTRRGERCRARWSACWVVAWS